MKTNYETNERLIEDGKKRQPTGRYHMLVTYLPKEEIERVLNHWRDRIDSALYVYHDRDHKVTDQTEGKLLSDTDDSERETKEAHWHILLKLYGNTTESAVRKYFYRFRVTEKKEIDGAEQEVLVTTTNQLVDSVGSARDYLTHENDPDKFHYSKSEVYTFGRGWEAFLGASRHVDTAMEIVERVGNNTSLRRLVKDYGKDFVYHYTAYREMAQAIRAQEMKAQRYLDLAERAIKMGTDVMCVGGDDMPTYHIDARKYNEAVAIVTEFENDFMLWEKE